MRRPSRGRVSCVTLALLLHALPLSAQDGEDEAHRLDRLRTQALNARSAAGYAPALSTGAATADQRDYAAARAAYQRQLAEWRSRVAACRAGYYGACQE